MVIKGMVMLTILFLPNKIFSQSKENEIINARSAKDFFPGGSRTGSKQHADSYFYTLSFGKKNQILFRKTDSKISGNEEFESLSWTFYKKRDQIIFDVYNGTKHILNINATAIETRNDTTQVFNPDGVFEKPEYLKIYTVFECSITNIYVVEYDEIFKSPFLTEFLEKLFSDRRSSPPS